MDDTHDSQQPRKKPGAGFFFVTMTFYLILIYGSSLIMLPNGGMTTRNFDYPAVWPWLAMWSETLVDSTLWEVAGFGLVFLFGSMALVFLLTRRLVGGPAWLGSLAGTFLMAHPAKTEVLFSPNGMYYGMATFTTLLTLLMYAQVRQEGGVVPFAMALLFFSIATGVFALNAALFGVLILMELFVGDREARNWLRLLPFLGVTMVANWFHLDILYAQLPTLDAIVAPLLLVFYPIGLLPETVAHVDAHAWQGWVWGMGVMVLLVWVLFKVQSAPFRFAVLAVLFYRFFPGALPIDYVTQENAGQLFFPLAMCGVALAALSAWLMRFEAWGRPTVAITTILCLILFVLQFQANRAYSPVNALRDYYPAETAHVAQNDGAAEATESR